MDDHELEEGKSWVGKKIRQIADDRNIPVQKVEWGPVELPDWDENLLYSIAIYSREKRKVIKFTYAELVDCPNTQETQKTIEKRLSTVICSPPTSAK